MSQQYGTSSTISVQMAGPFGSAGTPVEITSITLLASGWKGAISPYSQEVTVSEVSANSKVDLQLNEDQLEAFRYKALALTAVNDGGTVTVYAIGDKPAENITVQATITEVTAQ